MTSLAKEAAVESFSPKRGLFERVDHWLNAMPHPSVVVEIASDRVAAARWSAVGAGLDESAELSIPAGTLAPSPVETNVVQSDSLASALSQIFRQVPPRGAPVALLIPDPVIRVFMLAFETLPRRSDDVLPLLRWKLKKSVPFDVDETVVSWMRQKGSKGELEVVTAIARRRILREYEEIVEAAGAHPGVVLSSTLATLPLLSRRGASMLVRLGGKALTTAIVHGETLCVYRSTEVPAGAESLDFRGVLNEVFPSVAYYQDTWGEGIDRAYLGGFGMRGDQMKAALANELNVEIHFLNECPGVDTHGSDAVNLVARGLGGLVGWQLNKSL